MAGYSGTPLARKLGIKDGFHLCVANAPADYVALLSPLPSGVTISTKGSKEIDLWHFFTISAEELRRRLPVMMSQIKSDGMIWVSWPKRASKVRTDVTEDLIRDVALPLGLVDIKVCAVDEVWSGLKLVIRKENRK
ncbi:MAG TPA: DUF3052 domain-containing protein [Blastocatellia bacterium]|nr:DUF3052 domain-containing protein [Blastocatellia bacterium]